MLHDAEKRWLRFALPVVALSGLVQLLATGHL